MSALNIGLVSSLTAWYLVHEFVFPARQGFFYATIYCGLGDYTIFSLISWFVAFPVYMVMPAHFDKRFL